MQVMPEKWNTSYGEGSGTLSSRSALTGICAYDCLVQPLEA